MTAHGVYEMRTQRRRVGDHVLAPGWTSYRHRLRYQTFDVTGSWRRRRTRSGAWLADGWYRGRLGFGGGQRNVYGDRTGLLAQLEVEATPTARPRRVATDGAGAPAPGPDPDGRPLRRRDGTTPASSRPVGRTAGFDDRAWAPAATRTVARTVLVAPPTGRRCAAPRARASVGGHRVARRAGPSSTSARTSSAGSGSAVAAPAGHDGHAPSRRGARGRRARHPPAARADATDELHPARAAGVETWEPPVHLPRLPLRRGRRLARRARPGRRRRRSCCHTDMRAHGLVQLLRTDCSTGSTRTSCGACAATSSTCRPTARSATSGSAGPATSRCSRRRRRSCTTAPALLASWLADLAAEQRASRHRALVVPSSRGSPLAAGPPAAAWGDAAVIVPWVLHERFGDLGLLRRSIASMRAWVDRRRARRRPTTCGTAGSSSATGSTRAAPPDEPGAARTDPYLVATAYLARTAAARRPGRRDARRRGRRRTTRQLADRVAAAFRDEYVTPSGVWPATPRPPTPSRSRSTCCDRGAAAPGARRPAGRTGRGRRLPHRAPGSSARRWSATR